MGRRLGWSQPIIQATSQNRPAEQVMKNAAGQP
jgi:hypothetical protein